MMAENNMSADHVEGSGKRGQVLKEDVMKAVTAPSACACCCCTGAIIRG